MCVFIPREKAVHARLMTHLGALNKTDRIGSRQAPNINHV